MNSEDYEISFEFAKRKDGSSEFEDFIKSLPKKDSAKIMATIAKIKKYGFETAKRMEWVKKLDDNLYEIRSKVSSNIQRIIYFQFSGNRYIITHGFTKKTQKTPKNEIEHAKKIMNEYLK